LRSGFDRCRTSTCIRARCTPALDQLEQRGLIEAEWAPSENNRPANYYMLTSVGREALKGETAAWERLSSAISSIVKPVS
jgi:DNA-binding PadR family transcriptional regulator